MGPLMAGFAVPAESWHWSLWEIVWIAAPVVVLLIALMPETSASTFVIGTLFILQSIFVYLPLSYPTYAASLFGGNDLTRSSMACGSVLFARPLFLGLGIAEGVTLLACLSIVGIFGTIAIYYYGARLRAKSKFAQG